MRIITKEKGVDISVIDMLLLDTRREKNLLGTFISDLVLSLLSYVAENERGMIRQRQAEGIAAAKAKGIRFGRPPKPLLENFDTVYRQWKLRKLTNEEAAKECGMPPQAFVTGLRIIRISHFSLDKNTQKPILFYLQNLENQYS